LSKTQELIETIKAELREEIKAELMRELEVKQREMTPWEHVKEAIAEAWPDKEPHEFYQIINAHSILIRKAFGLNHTCQLDYKQVGAAIYLVKEIARGVKIAKMIVTG